MKAKSLQAYSIPEITDKLDKVLESGFKPTLAFIFSSIAHDIPTLSTVFTQHNIDIAGGTTCGEFADDEIFEKSIVVMLTDMNKNHYRIYFDEISDYSGSFEAGQALATYSKEHFKTPAYISMLSLIINGEKLVDGIHDILQNDFSIFGGMSGDDATMVATYAFTNDKSANNGLVTVVIDTDKVAVKGLAICGWEPLGGTNLITKAEGNVIYTINDKPALDTFKAFFGEYHSVNESDGTVAIATAQYPIQIKRENGYVLRAPLNANEEDGSLIMAGPIKKGEEFRFSIAPGFEIIEETIDGFKTFKDTNGEVDALILFSCMARHLSLGPLVEQEIEGINELWDAPLAGFFTYGEIGSNINGASYYYNETCSLVTLKEI